MGGGDNGKLVGQIFCISGYVGDTGYIGDQYQAQAELGTWYGSSFWDCTLSNWAPLTAPVSFPIASTRDRTMSARAPEHLSTLGAQHLVDIRQM